MKGMKILTILSILMGMAMLMSMTGCMNEHADFCKEASNKLCDKCASCGADGFKNCGFMDITDAASCRETLFRICEAYEVDYNREVARNCLKSIETSTCDAPKSEVCSRLF